MLIKTIRRKHHQGHDPLIKPVELHVLVSLKTDNTTLTCVGFLLLVTGLRPGTVGLTLGPLDEAYVFLTVRLTPLEAGLDAPSLGVAVFRGTAPVSFVEDGLLTLFFGRAASSALTSSTISSISLAASISSMVDADNNSATERRRKTKVQGS